MPIAPIQRQVASGFADKQDPSQCFDADAFEVADRFTMPLGYTGLSPTFVHAETAVEMTVTLCFYVR